MDTSGLYSARSKWRNPSSDDWSEWGELPTAIIQLVRACDAQGLRLSTDELLASMTVGPDTVRACAEALHRMALIRISRPGGVSLGFGSPILGDVS